MSVTSDEWLRALFSGTKKVTNSNKQQAFGDVPNFERNKVTNQILDALQVANQAAEHQVDEEIKIMTCTKRELSAESTRLNKILGVLKLDAKHLSDDSLLLDLTSLVSYAAQKVDSVEELLDQVTDDMNLSCNQTRSLQRLQNLEKIRESLNQMQINDGHVQAAKKRETEFLAKKTVEYAGHIRHLEKKLEGVECRSDIKHGELEKKAKKLKGCSEKLSQLRTKLSLYSDLTPDINLARIQVENLRDEISQIEKQITDNISNIHAN